MPPNKCCGKTEFRSLTTSQNTIGLTKNSTTTLHLSVMRSPRWNHGFIIFLDLCDKYGTVQIVSDPDR